MFVSSKMKKICMQKNGKCIHTDLFMVCLRLTAFIYGHLATAHYSWYEQQNWRLRCQRCTGRALMLTHHISGVRTAAHCSQCVQGDWRSRVLKSEVAACTCTWSVVAPVFGTSKNLCTINNALWPGNFMNLYHPNVHIDRVPTIKSLLYIHFIALLYLWHAECIPNLNEMMIPFLEFFRAYVTTTWQRTTYFAPKWNYAYHKFSFSHLKT